MAFLLVEHMKLQYPCHFVLAACRSVLFNTIAGSGHSTPRSQRASGAGAAVGAGDAGDGQGSRIQEISEVLKEGPDSKRTLDTVKSMDRTLNRSLTNVGPGTRLLLPQCACALFVGAPGQLRFSVLLRKRHRLTAVALLCCTVCCCSWTSSWAASLKTTGAWMCLSGLVRLGCPRWLKQRVYHAAAACKASRLMPPHKKL